MLAHLGHVIVSQASTDEVFGLAKGTRIANLSLRASFIASTNGGTRELYNCGRKGGWNCLTQEQIFLQFVSHCSLYVSGDVNSNWIR